MGRTKGQPEKVNLRNLSDTDYHALLRGGKKSLQHWFSGLQDAKEWLYEASLAPEKHDLTARECSRLLKACEEYPKGITEELERRKATSAISTELANKLIKTVEKHFAENPRTTTSQPASISRRRVHEAYKILKDDLSRAPDHRELENHNSLSAPPRISRENIRRTVNRMSLPLCDGRILKSLDAAFVKARLRNGRPLSIPKHVATLREVFHNNKCKGPEAERLRCRLKDAAFDRVIDVVSDERCLPFIVKRVVNKSYLDGRPFRFSEEEISSIRPGARLEHIATIDNSTGANELLMAVITFSKLWRNTSLWNFDSRWLRFEPELPQSSEAEITRETPEIVTELLPDDPSNWTRDWLAPETLKMLGLGLDLSWIHREYDVEERFVPKITYGSFETAVDYLLLRLILGLEDSLSPSRWLRKIAGNPESSRWVAEIWKGTPGLAVEPDTIRDSIKGVEALLDLFAEKGLSDCPSCAELGNFSSDFQKLVKFLEEPNLVSKGHDYGFFFDSSN